MSTIQATPMSSPIIIGNIENSTPTSISTSTAPIIPTSPIEISNIIQATPTISSTPMTPMI